jgi:hypothetical protein
MLLGQIIASNPLNFTIFIVPHAMKTSDKENNSPKTN